MSVRRDAGTAALDVLIVEDDHTAGALFGQILRGHGYGTRSAVDAESALAEIEDAVPDAILLDLRLPTIDGLELLRRMRAMAGLAATPVVVITGDYFVDDEIVLQLERLGARTYFKPLWEEDLVRITSELFAS